MTGQSAGKVYHKENWMENFEIFWRYKNNHCPQYTEWAQANSGYCDNTYNLFNTYYNM